MSTVTPAQYKEAAAARRAAATDVVWAPSGGQRSPEYQRVFDAWCSLSVINGNAGQGDDDCRSRNIERRYLHWFMDAWGRGARSPDAMLALLAPRLPEWPRTSNT